METPQEIIRTLPKSPGVYIYKNDKGEVIYIGKAVNLSKRVKQYFQREDAVGNKTPQLVAEIASIDTIQTEHEFDALLLEAKLIKQYQPKYNIVAKDDKSPLYIIMTIGEELPRIFFGRKPKSHLLNAEQATTLYFGPFQSAKAARNLLRSLRHVVPYCTQKRRTGNPCFYTHLGLCNPCPSLISKMNDMTQKNILVKQYRKNLFHLRDILSGKAVSVIQDMEKEMYKQAEKEQFEEAASIRNQINALRSLLSKRYDPTVYIQSDTMLEELFEKEQQELVNVLKQYYPNMHSVSRIECYDISNTMGTHATASMVVMVNGRIDKKEYRKFRIKTQKTPNDFAMMSEVISRRFNHPEWEYPDLLVIDGGKGQVNAVKTALENLTITNVDANELLPIIGLAKREEEIIVPTKNGWKVIRLPFSHNGLKLLQRLRDEAHRFAITYHKLLRKKAFVP